jgi:hypothetical protein
MSMTLKRVDVPIASAMLGVERWSIKARCNFGQGSDPGKPRS